MYVFQGKREERLFVLRKFGTATGRCVRAEVRKRPRFRVYKRDTCPAFTPLMYVLGSDRSLSHELLIVRHHNSPRVLHPFPSCPLAPVTLHARTTFPLFSALCSPRTALLFLRQGLRELHAVTFYSSFIAAAAKRDWNDERVINEIEYVRTYSVLLRFRAARIRFISSEIANDY